METMKKFKKFPAQWILALVVISFVVKSFVLLFEAGEKNFIDQVGAGSSVYAAKVWLEKGASQTAFLPKYPWVPGDVTLEILKKTQVYTHYFPGPEYVLYLFFKVFGDEDGRITLARFIPWIHILFSVLLFAFVAEKQVCRGWPWAKILIAGAIFWSPSIYRWAPSLHGSAYSTSYLLLAMTLGMCFGQMKKVWFPRFILFILGFLSNYMLLTNSLVMIAAPYVGFLLSEKSQSKKEALILSGFVLGGLVTAFCVHFVQVSVFLGSISLAWEDQIGTALRRGGEGDGSGPSRLELIGLYSSHVRAFFRVGALDMVWIGLFAAWIYPGSKNRKRNFMWAIGLAALASYFWVMLMKSHSVEHHHINPRIFLLLFASWICLISSLVEKKVSGKI